MCVSDCTRSLNVDVMRIFKKLRFYSSSFSSSLVCCLIKQRNQFSYCTRTKCISRMNIKKSISNIFALLVYLLKHKCIFYLHYRFECIQIRKPKLVYTQTYSKMHLWCFEMLKYMHRRITWSDCFRSVFFDTVLHNNTYEIQMDYTHTHTHLSTVAHLWTCQYQL